MAAGAVLMAVFWVGTLPVMVTLGVGLRGLAGPLRRHVPTACAVAMILVGLFAVAGRMVEWPAMHAGHHHTSDHGTR
jgi:sulfite exporter TauE/SafE